MFKEDWVGGRARVTIDEERVLYDEQVKYPVNGQQNWRKVPHYESPIRE